MCHRHRMIEPFEERQVRQGVISYGLSSFGYDIRLAVEFRVPHAGGDSAAAVVLDPKRAEEAPMAEHHGALTLAPGSFALGRSLEYFRIPRRVLTVCTGKSSYARVGVHVNVTPFEPEWEGHATLSLANTGRQPVRIHPKEGIAQILFFEGDEPPEISYADRKGKYQATTGVTQSKVDE